MTPEISFSRTDMDDEIHTEQFDVCEKKLPELTELCIRHNVSRAIFSSHGNPHIDEQGPMISCSISFADTNLEGDAEFKAAADFQGGLENLLGFEVMTKRLRPPIERTWEPAK